jgi:hypothetical protein
MVVALLGGNVPVPAHTVAKAALKTNVRQASLAPGQ